MSTVIEANLINTTHGLMDASLLRKEEGCIENEYEKTTWVEYWLEGELVHRSVNMELKQALISLAESATL